MMRCGLDTHARHVEVLDRPHRTASLCLSVWSFCKYSFLVNHIVFLFDVQAARGCVLTRGFFVMHVVRRCATVNAVFVSFCGTITMLMTMMMNRKLVIRLQTNYSCNENAFINKTPFYFLHSLFFFCILAFTSFLPLHFSRNYTQR